MRPWFNIKLGTWHIYKQCCSVLWDSFGPQFFGPLYHALLPNFSVRRKPKLVTLETFFTVIRLLLPLWEDELKHAQAALASQPPASPMASGLRDLVSLVRVLIPLVHCVRVCVFGVRDIITFVINVCFHSTILDMFVTLFSNTQ